MRNLMIDVASLAGGEIVRMQGVRKRGVRPGDPSRDVYGPRLYLHFEIADAPGNSDFGRSHRAAFEFTRDVPAWGRRRNGDALFEFDDLPMVHTPPQTVGLRRNMILDVEDIAHGSTLLGAVLVPKRHNGRPPGWEAPRPGAQPPTEHFGPDTYVHCLVAHDASLPDDLADPTAKAREFLRGAPPSMRRADNRPTHVFMGVPVHTDKPDPADVGL